MTVVSPHINSPASSFPDDAPSELNPLVASLYRAAWPATPDTTLGAVFDTLHTSPFHAVPVVGSDGILRGLVTDSDTARVLLAAPDAESRVQVRQQRLAHLMAMPAPLSLYLTARQAARQFDLVGRDVLPVVDEAGRYRGLLSRADLVQELARPFRPPLIGGMATPRGVYLTTGAHGGGVGWSALFLNGFVLSLITLTAGLLTLPLLPHLAPLPAALRPVAVALLQEAVPLVLLLLAVRFSAIAGYHAAEHQVVHAIERGEPLTVAAVRLMPRVHPRCGTNLVAASLIFFGGGGLLAALLARFGDWSELGYLVAGLIALASWRDVGAFLQRHVTTRPATDAQIESGIAAARDVLGRFSRAPYAPLTPLTRLWRMGFVQILLGFAFGLLFTYLLGALFPPLRPLLDPILK